MRAENYAPCARRKRVSVFLIEDLAGLVLWLLATVLGINVLFLCFMFYRRVARKRYFESKDAARLRYSEPTAAFLNGQLSVEPARDIFLEATAQAEVDAVQEMLLANVTAETADRVSELFFALGYVDRWARQAFGRRRAKALVVCSMRQEKAALQVGSAGRLLGPIRRMRLFSVPRMIAVDHLGKLAPGYAQVFLAEALRDPSSEVRRVSVTAMGRGRHSQAVPLIVEELRKALRYPGSVSARSAKASLVCYRLQDLHLLLPFLSDPDPQIRFFLVDVVREISTREAEHGLLNKNDFAPGLYDLFMEKLVEDASADVRARSAAVIRHFRDQAAVAALRKLLRDPNDFVRLHAVRACADRYYAELQPDLVERVGDNRWRVREAAVRALAALGPAATNRLYQEFLATKDQYSCEQISDEIQRTGLMRDLLVALSSGGSDAELALTVCKKLAAMGKTSLPMNAILTLPQTEPRLLLLDAMAVAPTPEFLLALQHLHETDSGALGSRAGYLLQKFTASAAGAS